MSWAALHRLGMIAQLIGKPEAAQDWFGRASVLRRELPERHGVAAVPVSAFCAGPEGTASLIRLAFCKSEQSIREGLPRLAR